MKSNQTDDLPTNTLEISIFKFNKLCVHGQYLKSEKRSLPNPQYFRYFSLSPIPLILSISVLSNGNAFPHPPLPRSISTSLAVQQTSPIVSPPIPSHHDSPILPQILSPGHLHRLSIFSHRIQDETLSCRGVSVHHGPSPGGNLVCAVKRHMAACYWCPVCLGPGRSPCSLPQSSS
jgi:hypothetical protein